MSQAFKFKYTEMREGNPAAAQDARGENSTYESESHVRNVCFIWPNGYRIFLNYSYLVSCEFQPEENRIVLSFTTHIVTLTGIRLENLFAELSQHLPKYIHCVDERYNQTHNANQPIVSEIKLTNNS